VYVQKKSCSLTSIDGGAFVTSPSTIGACSSATPPTLNLGVADPLDVEDVVIVDVATGGMVKLSCYATRI
jgi:hypothetical protein